MNTSKSQMHQINKKNSITLKKYVYYSYLHFSCKDFIVSSNLFISVRFFLCSSIMISPSIAYVQVFFASSTALMNSNSESVLSFFYTSLNAIFLASKSFISVTIASCLRFRALSDSCFFSFCQIHSLLVSCPFNSMLRLFSNNH